MNIFEIKTRLPNSGIFQSSRRSPISIRQPRSSSLSSSRNDFTGSVRTNIPVHHFGEENSKPTSFSYFRSTPSSPLPSRFADNTGKYIARVVNNSSNKPTLISSSNSYHQPNDSEEKVTTLPVYYQKDGSGFTLPVIRNTSGYLKNMSSVNSGVGSVSSVLRPSNNFQSRNNYTVNSREPSPSPYKTLNKQYSAIRENKDFDSDLKKQLYIGKVCFTEPVRSESYKSGLNKEYQSSSLNNLNRNYSSSSLNRQTNAPSKSILVNRKKFAYPPNALSLASPLLPKKSVTFAE
ncbi:hypothetical protein BpHYR1_027070 [Brachionus plicatilis]|uniref:Uncharacterized protein n=1 Tax=Brachionus plicatilis TaxID=10195 RepID=A0A3M7R5P0_BRAPC|nr:hypothetical protein BpHYR1_027070 [Brachionus plicatilis]